MVVSRLPLWSKEYGCSSVDRLGHSSGERIGNWLLTGIRFGLWFRRSDGSNYVIVYRTDPIGVQFFAAGSHLTRPPVRRRPAPGSDGSWIERIPITHLKTGES